MATDAEIIDQLKQVYGVSTTREILERALKLALEAAKHALPGPQGGGGEYLEPGLYTPTGIRVITRDPLD